MAFFDWLPARRAAASLATRDDDGAGGGGGAEVIARGRTAAVGPVAEDHRSGVMSVPGKIKADPRQERARFYARRIGFVRNAYRFMAFQAARCPWTIEVSDNGVDWRQASKEDEDLNVRWAWDALNSIHPKRGSRSESSSPQRSDNISNLQSCLRNKQMSLIRRAGTDRQ